VFKTTHTVIVLNQKKGTGWLMVKKRIIFAMFCLVTTLSAQFIVSGYFTRQQKNGADFYVGVSFCGDTTAEAVQLIDRIKTYTNLFVLQSGPVSENETATNEICQYAVDSGLKFIAFFGDLSYRALDQRGLLWRLSWLDYAKQRWGDSFLGLYYYDEPGGIQLDYNWTSSGYFRLFNATERNYGGAEDYFVNNFQDDPGIIRLHLSSISALTSDYAFYWFDYLAGYDTVLAEAGWNHTLSQDIALVRGAANLQNKSWGMIVTWKYRSPPFLDDADSILEQMRTAYECGAEYIVIFNYSEMDGNYYGTMTDEHFQALETFWNTVVTNPAVVHGSVNAEAVLVLPAHYAWGMRNPNDKIWGFWSADENSEQIWNISRQLLDQYGCGLDIVYDDPNFSVNGKYQHIYYWNDTIS
jgi:hypothetical protein